MKTNKKNLTQFLVWTRNGTAFCTTWFLILWVLFSHLYHQQTISVHSLTLMLLFVFGGVVVFSLLFTQVLIKRWCFTTRLTAFMLFIAVYECLAFYKIGFFQGTGTLALWCAFLGIVFVLYLTCIIIYQRYSKRKGMLYTKGLKNYQLQRKNENEK